MAQSTRSYIGSAVVPLRLVFLMWVVFSLQFYMDIDLSIFMLRPLGILYGGSYGNAGNFWGILGIFFAPMMHGNIFHLLSNTVPLLFLGGTLFFFYNRIGTIVFFRCYIITNVLVWLFAPPIPVIGASGLIYGLAAFLIAFGVLRRDVMSILISIVVIILYGGIFHGIFPSEPGVSWESHLAGAIVGVATAFMLKDTKKV